MGRAASLPCSAGIVQDRAAGPPAPADREAWLEQSLAGFSKATNNLFPTTSANNFKHQVPKYLSESCLQWLPHEEAVSPSSIDTFCDICSPQTGTPPWQKEHTAALVPIQPGPCHLLYPTTSSRMLNQAPSDSWQTPPRQCWPITRLDFQRGNVLGGALVLSLGGVEQTPLLQMPLYMSKALHTEDSQ